MVYDIILIVQVLAAVSLIGLVLIQQGKGADMGASFGSGASQTIFGSAGSGNFLTRTTAILAAIFFGASLGMAYVTNNSTKKSSIFDMVPVQQSELPSVSVAPEDVTPSGDLPQVSVDPVENQSEELPQVDVGSGSEAAAETEKAVVSEVEQSAEGAATDESTEAATQQETAVEQQ